MHDTYITEKSALLDNLRALGAVAHNIQLERGRSALYLDSGGRFQEEMATQRKQTDHAIADLNHIINDQHHSLRLNEAQHNILDALMNALQQLPQFRSDVLHQQTSFSHAINDYTYKYSMIIIDSMLEIARLSPAVNPTQLGALNKFLQWKERTGRQRALGVHGFHTESAVQSEYHDRMEALIAEQDSYYHAFLNFASDIQKKLVSQCLESIHTQELDHLSDIQTSNAHISVTDWFQLMTRKIDLMRETELALLETLVGDRLSGAASSDTVPPRTNQTVKPNKAILQAIPLFKSLSDSDLESLLQKSSIRHYPRGKLLIHQGEPAMRIYVILHGWIKIYNSTPSGDETILQMLSSGDTVLETSAILDSPAPYSVQVAEDATMISLPAPLLRQSVRDSQELSYNIINNISLRSQQLIHQIEQSRLASAEERVGWFLLRLMLENGNTDTHINIPYEKALAAAYLDMRPETFSRILKKFRQQGFDVQNDRVVLPHNHALCHYCRQSTAMLCEHHNSPECPLNQQEMTV